MEEPTTVEPKEGEEVKKDDDQEKKEEDVKMEEVPSEEKVEAMDTSEPSEVKEEPKDGKFICTFISSLSKNGIHFVAHLGNPFELPVNSECTYTILFGIVSVNKMWFKFY